MSQDAVQKMEDFSEINNHVEVERTELANELIRRKEMDFRWRLSEIASKSPYAAMMETYVVVNDKEKTGTGFPKMIVDELNRVNQRLKPRNVKETMLKTGSYVCICDQMQWAF
jgi:hypothetical protein